MTITPLPWDSAFFGMNIGKAESMCSGMADLDSLIDLARESGFRLIYWTTPPGIDLNPQTIRRLNGTLAVRRITYRLDFRDDPIQIRFSEEYDSGILTDELEELAYISGRYSRFNTDKNFQSGDFHRLYKTWIFRSISHEIADSVFVVKDTGNIAGMATVKHHAPVGQMGMMAVHPVFQRKGYATDLVNACLQSLQRKGIYAMTAATQAENQETCRLFEKCGFYIHSMSDIFHFWI